MAAAAKPRDQVNFGALRAIDPVTGDRKWEFRYPNVSSSGVLTTASGLVFAGDGDGNIMAFESKTGKNLWHYQLGVGIRSTGGTTYMVDGRQYFLVPVGQHADRIRAAAVKAFVSTQRRGDAESFQNRKISLRLCVSALKNMQCSQATR